MEQQTPKSLFSSDTSLDSLNLTNYVDQMFNVDPVSIETIPLVTKSEEDVKLDNKLNINFDNLSIPGLDQVRALLSPTETFITLDVSEIEDNQKVYLTEQSGHITIQVSEPSSGDYVTVKCSDNSLFNASSYISSSIPLSAMIPVAKDQTIVFDWQTSSTVSIFLVPLGSGINVGETLAETRDYRAIMANIGFPSVGSSYDLVLPQTNTSQLSEGDGYYSLAIILDENDYCSLSTEYYGASISYNGTNKLQYIFLPVTAQNTVSIDYQLTNEPEYFKFIPTKGGANSNDNY